MNPFGCGPPAPGLRGRRKGGLGPRRPQTVPPGRPVRDAAVVQPEGRARGAIGGDTGPASGRARAPRPRGPPTDNARGRASPRAHRVRSRPRRRQRFSHHLRHRPRRRRRRARRGHANEPTVPAAPRRAGAGPPRALVRKRRWPLPRLLVQARYLLLLGGGSEGEKLPRRGRR